MTEQNKGRTSKREGWSAFSFPPSDANPLTLARAIIEERTGYIDKFPLLSIEKEGLFVPLLKRAEYSLEARIAYTSPRLFILEGFTRDFKRNLSFVWKIEVEKQEEPESKVPQYKTEKPKPTIVWVENPDFINGGR